MFAHLPLQLFKTVTEPVKFGGLAPYLPAQHVKIGVRRAWPCLGDLHSHPVPRGAHCVSGSMVIRCSPPEPRLNAVCARSRQQVLFEGEQGRAGPALYARFLVDVPDVVVDRTG